MARPLLSMVCLLGLAAAGLAETWPLNHRQMQIPIQIEAVRRAEIKELQLWHSTDEGRNWSLGGVATPEKEAFTFTAPTDGLYWFGLMIVRKDGAKEPPTAFSLKPSMKVIVDTTRPVANVDAADRQGDEVTVRYSVKDSHPDWATFKLEYRSPDAPSWQWTAIAAKGSANGQAKFRPTQNGPLTVRLQVKDQAGNETIAQKEVAGAVSTVSANTTNAGVPPPDAPPLLVTTGNTTTPPLATGGTTSGANPIIPPSASGIVPPPDAPSRDVRSPVAAPLPSAEQPGKGQTQPDSRGTTLPAMERNLLPAATPTQPQDNSNRLVASSTDVQSPAVPTPGGAGERTQPPQNPGVLLSNSLQITLEYEVNKVGPSGVGSVELWLTRNNGANWEKYAEDSDLKPPMVVDLPAEGVYGISLVVRSRAGLGRRPPRDGERPQMVVEVDASAPEAKLYAPQPVRGQRDGGQLQIVWEASDKNLTPTPITLEWAERQGGPWQPIAADLPNTGRHHWKLPANLPYRVYMRLLVRDAAGNVSVAETRDPVLVDLSEPEGVILNVRPAAGARQ